MKQVRFKIFPEVPEWRSLEVGSSWDWFLVLRRRLTRAYALLLLGLILFGVGLFARAFMVGFATLFTFAFFTYLWLRDVATKVTLKRESAGRAREGDTVPIRYQIENVSRLPIWSMTLRDVFGGTSDGTIVETSSVWLGGLRRRRLTAEVKCNQGMGKFTLGPTQLDLADPLGIFVFEITWDLLETVEVFPRVGGLPDIPLKGRLDSEFFGIYEQLSAGGSVNFMGIRPYVQGDPLKTISWKMSAKYGELMVKIFDRSVSDEVSLLMDLSPAIQVGYKKDSTWSHMKDLGLRLMRQCIDNGNRIQILSQHLYVPWGSGADHWATTTMMVSLTDPDFTGTKEDFALEAYVEWVPHGSTVFYLTPVLPKQLPDLRERLFKFRAHPADVVVFLFDSVSYLNPEVPELQAVASFAVDPGHREQLEHFRAELSAVGIRTYVLGRDQDFGRSILETAL